MGLKVLFTPMSSRELIENAFRRMKKVNIAKEKNFWQWQKKKEIAKLKTFAEYLQEELYKVVKNTANFDALHPFHKELLSILSDIVILKKSLARVNESKKLIKQLSSRLLLNIKKTPCKRKEDFKLIKKKSKEFLGRVSSVIKRLKNTLELLKKASKALKEMPDVDFSIPTAVFAGYPNVGKSTMLKRLTKAKPRIASYPFTTLTIQLGILENKKRIQLVDTPGLLDKPKERRNVVEKKAVAALRHLAKLIIFIFDSTANHKKQLKLLKQLRSFNIPIVVLISKTDIKQANNIEKILKGYEFMDAGFDVDEEKIKWFILERFQ